MKVYLLRSPELDVETFGNVLNVLRQFPGSITFVPGESEQSLENLQLDVWEKEEYDYPSTKSDKPPVTGKKGRSSAHGFHSWEYFFNNCRDFRASHHLDPKVHVFLLTDKKNDTNWFGSVAPSMRDYFIHTADWNLFFGSEADARFPIAYEVVVWLLRHLMFDQREEIIKAVHKPSIGCANDFCLEKNEIVLKMRTADVCSDCMQILEKRGVPRQHIAQLFDIMEGIRENLIFRGRSKLLRRPSKLEVRGYIQKIFLVDLGDLEVRLNPKERSVYLLFLNHPEGIHLSELPDFREEISSYYKRFTSQSQLSEQERSIDILVSPFENDIHVVLARIKRKFKDLVGEELLAHYAILGEHGEKKQILLDREFVILVD